MRLKHFISVFLALLTLSIGQVWGEVWVKVTSAPTNWSGEYLLVYEPSNSTTVYVYTGIDGQNGVGSESATLSNGLLTKPDDATAIRISARTGTNAGKYSIKILSGTNANKYIGKSSNANGIDLNDSEVNNEISYSTDQVTIKSAGGAYLRFNSASNEMRFRYYKSSSYTNQQKIQLYKKCYTVTYNKNGGTSTMTDSNSPYAPNATVTVLDNAFTAPDGKTFDGWNSKADGSGGDFGATFTITQDTTLYAQWASSDCAYKVNISAGTPEDGASFGLSKTGEQNCCDALTINVTDITAPEGKRFKRITETGNIAAANVEISQANKTVTYAATSSGNSEINVEFEEIPSHNIIFHTNGGTCATSQVSVLEGVTYSTMPTVIGLTTNCEYNKFVGWKEGNNIDDTSVKPTLVTSVTMGENDVHLYAVYSKTVGGSTQVNDVLTPSSINNPSSYTSWSGKNLTSDAVYAGETTGGTNYLQMRATSPSGIVSTTSGGNCSKVTIVWNSATTISRTVDIYGKNSAYTGSVDLYNNTNKGTLLGSLESTNNQTELEISGNYEYIGIRSNDGALYLSSVTFTWIEGITTYSVEANCCTPHTITTSVVGGTLTLSPNVTEACANTAITLTANSPDGNHEGNATIVVTDDDDDDNDITTDVLSGSTLTMPSSNITITATYAAKSTPTVTITDGEDNPVSALNFGTTLKMGDDVPEAQTFVIAGANLTSALTVESSNTSLYAVSYAEGALTPDANKEVEATITITPQAGITSTAGTKSADITISGGGLASSVVVTASMTIQQTYTVNWWINGGENPAATLTDVTETAVVVPTNFSAFTDCSDLHFVGWAESAISGGSSSEAPTIVTPIKKIGTANKDYYAVFATGDPGDNTRVTSTSELTNGTKVYLYSTFVASNVTYGAVAKEYVSGNNVRATSGTVADNKLTPGEGAGVYTIGITENGYTFNDGTYYLYAASTSQNHLKGRENIGDDRWAEFSISISNGEASITSVGNTNRGVMQFNKNADTGDYTKAIFSCYQEADNTKYNAIQLFKQGTTNFTMYYTTCPHVARVTLSAATVEHGSISFAKGGNAITSIATAGENPVTVDVVAAPEPGYELTGVNLTSEDVNVGQGGASYSNNVITIPANEEGTLTATATFAQKNYEVIVEEYPVIGATLTGATTTAHYNDEITISTNEPAGYKFSGWCMYEVTDIERETDIADQFFTGDYDEYEFATTAKFKMPNRSIVAEANFKKIYSVDEFMDTEFTKTNNEWYYVTGLVAEVPATLYNNKKMTYVISDDATKTGLYLTLYRGLGEDGADFSAVSDLAVGDRVVIYGKWSSQHKNMNEGNYILKDCLTKKALSALTIVGSASVTTYDVGDSFDKTGLSLKATYNTGYEVANYTGTTITSDYDAPTTFTAGVTSVTVSAEEGLISTSRDIDVTVSSAVLDYAELASGYQTEFWAKEQYKEPKLNAYLNDVPATVLANVIGVTNTTGLDMSVAGDKSVTVTYTRKVGQSADVEYNFTVKAVVVDADHAHSVADARAIIDVDKTEGEDLDLELEATKTHVIGIVKSVTALTDNNEGKYTIVIKDQTDAAKEMTLYQVTLNGVSSVEENDLIKAYGNLYYHSQSSKYEINTGGEIVWKQPKVSITIANQTLEIDQTLTIADVATIDPAAATVEYNIVANDDNCITLSEGLINAIAEGTATVSISAAHDGYLANSKTFTVTVKPAATHTNVVLYAEYDGHYYALNNAAGVTEINVCGGKVVVPDNDTKNAIVWDRAVNEGKATFKNGDKYLATSNQDKDLSVANTSVNWIWSESGYYQKENVTSRAIIYRRNGETNAYKNYATSNLTTDGYVAPVIYTGEVVIGAIETIRENVSSGRYGTICLPDGCKLLNGTLYAVAYYGETSQKIFFDEVLNGQMEAGTPYIFLPNAGETELKGIYTDDANADAGSANGLVGYLGDVEDDVPVGMYILNNNQYWRVDVFGTAKVLPNRAYIDLDGISRKEAALAPGRRRISMNVNNGSQLPTDIEGVEVNNAPRKVMIDGQIYIIRGEKRYDVRGQLVK